MAAIVTIAAAELLFVGGTVVDIAGGNYALIDNSGGPFNGQGGDGHYTISVTNLGAIVITKGNRPAPSPTLAHLANAVVVAGVITSAGDLRVRNVNMDGVNDTIMAAPNGDGSWISAGAVTFRTLSAALQFSIDNPTVPHGTSFPASPVYGQLFFRSDNQLLAIYNGSVWLYVNGVIPDGTSLPVSGVEGELFYLTSGSVGLYVWHSSAWVAVGGGSSGPTAITYGASYPGSPVDGELFYRTDLGYLFVYELGITTWVQCSPSPVLSMNSLVGALSIADATNGGINVAAGGSTISLSIQIASGTSNPGSPATGNLFYRTDLAELLLYNGSAWVAVLPAGAGGVSSLNALVGALSIAAGTGIGVGAAGSSVTVTLNVAKGTSNPGSPSAGTLFFRSDTSTLEYFDGTSWFPAAPVSGVTSLNSLTGALSIADGASGGINVSASGSTISLTIEIATGTSYPGSPATGQVFYRTDLLQLSLYNGSSWVSVAPDAANVSSLNSLTGALSIAAGSGIAVAAAGSSVTVTVEIGTGTSYPGSPATGQLFFRTDLGALFIYGGSSWLACDSLAQLEDVSLSSLTSGQVLQYNGSKWVNASIGSVLSSYDATIAAESSLTHFWKLNDAAGSTSAVDSKGSSNLTQNGTVVFGSKPITRDGETSALFDGNVANYLTLPSGVLPSGATAFSVEMVIQMVEQASANIVWFSACSGNELDIYNDQTTYKVVLNLAGTGGAQTGPNIMRGGTPYHLVFTQDGNTSNILYVNGIAMTQAFARGTFSGTGAVGQKTGGNFPFFGQMAKLATYNAKLTAAQVRAHYAQM
jgi:hypothetical protein